MEQSKQIARDAMKSRMINDQVNLGTLVELTLDLRAELNLMGTVPTYELGTPDEVKPRVCAGYAVDIEDQHISLLTVWDKEHKKHPDFGHVGGVRVYWDAIASYRKL
jgi:hypothetical protein